MMIQRTTYMMSLCKTGTTGSDYCNHGNFAVIENVTCDWVF